MLSPSRARYVHAAISGPTAAPYSSLATVIQPERLTKAAGSGGDARAARDPQVVGLSCCVLPVGFVLGYPLDAAVEASLQGQLRRCDAICTGQSPGPWSPAPGTSTPSSLGSSRRGCLRKELSENVEAWGWCVLRSPRNPDHRRV